MQPTNNNNLKNVALSFICNEDWDSMTPSANGRHCSVCNKEVVDFTGKSAQAFAQAMEDANGKLCGRFKTKQTVHQPQFRFDRAAALLLTTTSLTLLSTNANAQITVGKIALPRQQQEVVKGNVVEPTVRGEVAVPPKDTTKIKPSNWVPTKPTHWKEQYLLGDTIAPVVPPPDDTTGIDTAAKSIIPHSIPPISEGIIDEEYTEIPFGPGDTTGLSKVHSIPLGPEPEAPKYPGGDKALQDAIAYNIRWPEKLEHEVVITVELSINTEGIVTEAFVIKGYRSDVDSEALRVGRLLVFTPAKGRNGNAVTGTLIIPINFK